MTTLPPDPAIDPREVARLARELYIHDDDLASHEAILNAETYLRAEQTYLAEHKIPSAIDPRDAEIRELATALEVANRGIARCSREADEWRALCEKLQHRIREIQEAPKPAEPTRTERLVAWVRETRAIGFDVELHKELLIVGNEYLQLDATEAAAVRAALEE